MNIKSTASNPVVKKSAQLPPEVARQLGTIEGALALADHYKNVANNADEKLAAVYAGRERAARKMAKHLAYQEKVKHVSQIIALDKTDAANAVRRNREALEKAETRRRETLERFTTASMKLDELRASVTKSMQERQVEVNAARTAFSQAMSADDDGAQRVAAENLSKAQADLRLAEKSNPDVIRLQGLETRAASEYAAHRAASIQVEEAHEELAQSVFRESLVLLDEATDKMAQAWLSASAARAECRSPAYLLNFQNINIYAHSGARITTAVQRPKEEQTTYQALHLNGLVEAARYPDLTVFVDELA